MVSALVRDHRADIAHDAAARTRTATLDPDRRAADHRRTEREARTAITDQ
jgi:hypothetical protein